MMMTAEEFYFNQFVEAMELEYSIVSEMLDNLVRQYGFEYPSIVEFARLMDLGKYDECHEMYEVMMGC